MTNDKIETLDEILTKYKLAVGVATMAGSLAQTPNGVDDAESIYAGARELAKKQILELIVEAREETAKAYGGCTICYGKGYATVRKGRSYRKNGIYKTWEMNDEMNYCTCDRGKQLAQLQDSPSKRGDDD